MPKLNIVADQNMPLVQELFAEYGNVRLLPGRDISAADLQDADVLLVRSTSSYWLAARLNLWARLP